VRGGRLHRPVIRRPTCGRLTSDAALLLCWGIRLLVRHEMRSRARHDQVAAGHARRDEVRAITCLPGPPEPVHEQTPSLARPGIGGAALALVALPLGTDLATHAAVRPDYCNDR
jgi:hypothetical protein